jgi:hypothetical protein
MGRYEVRFYDALNRVKVAVELDALSDDQADFAARVYLRSELVEQLATFGLVLGVVRELR